MIITSSRFPLRVFIADDETLARQRLSFLLDDIQLSHPTVLVGEAADGETAIKDTLQSSPDVLILDIRMPGKDGLDVARYVMDYCKQHQQPCPAFLFTTAYRDHACEAFDVNAIDYLVKPVRLERLSQALDKVYNRQLVQTSAAPVVPARFSIVERQYTKWIDFDELLYFKAEHKYTTVMTRHAEYIIETPLSELEVQYPTHFLRIHRNCIVYKPQLSELRLNAEGWAVKLKDCPTWLEVSRRQLPVLKQVMRGGYSIS